MIGSLSFSLLLNSALPEARENADARAAMDEDEFRAFYERTARPLWSYLSRITGDGHQADDLLQEAYYRFYRAAARYENEAHRRNSLFQIATNLARDAARRRRENVPIDEDLALPDVPQHHAATKTDLARAMKKLPAVQREMLWLAYAQGASHEEIAEILGLRQVSIRTMLLRARRKMAELLS